MHSRRQRHKASADFVLTCSNKDNTQPFCLKRCKILFDSRLNFYLSAMNQQDRETMFDSTLAAVSGENYIWTFSELPIKTDAGNAAVVDPVDATDFPTRPLSGVAKVTNQHGFGKANRDHT